MEMVDRFKKVHGNKYCYDFVNYINSKTKVKIICPTHGEFLQLPYHHLKGSGCKLCGMEKSHKKQKTSFKKLINQFNEIHNHKYNYSKVSYINNNTKICITCPKHGDFTQTPKNHKKGKGCPKCGKESAWKDRKIDTNTATRELKKVHGDKYDYSKVNYVKGNKIQIICQEHGSFYQDYYSHKGGAGCPECSRKQSVEKRKAKEEVFFEKCNKIHDSFYNYQNSEYTLAKNDIYVECPIHGGFYQNSWYHSHGSNCPSCAGQSSSLERFIESFLNKNNISFTNRDKTLLRDIGKRGRELDFYLKDYNLAIECNGLYWHSELAGKDKNYHLEKLDHCNERGIKLINILENEIKLKPKIVAARLKSILNLNKYKVAARKCKVIEIDSKLKNKFLNKYHIQGEDKSLVKLGLFYKRYLVAVMTFCKNRKALGKVHVNGEWELSRFSTIANFSIMGGAGKLLKHFERNWQPVKITSYADRRWSEGDLYKKLGFKKARESKPNYWYFYNGSLNLKHRFNFRKSILSKKLDNYDNTKSAWINMQKNNWNRIWDCGNIVFEKKQTLEQGHDGQRQAETALPFSN